MSREPRLRRAFWLGICGLLVLGPLLFTLARGHSFEATQGFVPIGNKPYSAIYEAKYYESLLDDPVLREQVRLHIGPETMDYDGVVIRRGSDGRTMELTVRAATPDKARVAIDVLGPQLEVATRRQLVLVATSDSERVRERLRTRSSRDARLRRRARLRRLASILEAPPTRMLLGAARPLSPPDRWADRLVDDLPGEFAARPNPAWAALSGLLVAVTLWATCLLLYPPEGSPRRAGMRARLPARKQVKPPAPPESVSRAVKSLLWGWLHLAVLWTFAVAEPLLEILADEPAFFVARDNTPGDIVAVAIMLTRVRRQS